MKFNNNCVFRLIIIISVERMINITHSKCEQNDLYHRIERSSVCCAWIVDKSTIFFFPISLYFMQFYRVDFYIIWHDFFLALIQILALLYIILYRVNIYIFKSLYRVIHYSRENNPHCQTIV